MMRNTTFNLPDDLVARAKSYAAAHGTTMTAIIREHLEAVTFTGKVPAVEGPLVKFSSGQLSSREAIGALGLRDYAELLVRLGDADLPMPAPPPHEVDNQAAAFAKIWKQT